MPSSQPSEVVFSNDSGFYEHALELQISSTSPIVYTLDGSVPTGENGTPYEGPIHLAEGQVTVVRARTVDAQGGLGAILTRHFFVGLDTTLPLLSLASAPSELWSEETGIFANWGMTGRDWERDAQVFYLDEGYSAGFQSSIGVRVHGDWSRQFEKRSLRLYWRDSYGQPELSYPVFSDSAMQRFDTLVLHGGGEDWHNAAGREWSLICNQLGAELMSEMGGYATHSQPVLLFINGEAMGIYYLRERIDAAYLRAEYAVSDAELFSDPQNPTKREVEEGDLAAWDALTAYVASADLTDPDAYAYVAERVDLENLMDYYILQIYASDNDWPHQNVTIFRDTVGDDRRFKHIVWDIDHAFGIDSDLYMNMIAWLYAEHPSVSDMSDTLLIRSLLENDAFRGQFLERAAYLLNTVLAPANVCAQIDTLAARIGPDIAIEAERWASTSEWSESIELMKEFARQRPDVLRQHLVDWYGLPGTFRLEVAIPVAEKGSLWLDGNLLTESYSGIHFATVPADIRVEGRPGYLLVEWEGVEEPGSTTRLAISAPTAGAVRPVFGAAGD